MLQFGVKCVPQAVTKQIQGQHDQADDNCGNHKTEGVGIDAVQSIGCKRTERGHRCVNTKTKEGKIAFREDRTRNLERCGNDNHADAVRDQMLANNSACLCAGGLRRENVFLLTQGKNLTADQTRHGNPVKKRKYKEKADNEKRDKKFSTIMASVKEDLDEKTFAELSEEGKVLSLDQLGAFENKVKAFAYEATKKNKDKESDTDIMKFGTSDNISDVNDDVFDRISKM